MYHCLAIFDGWEQGSQLVDVANDGWRFLERDILEAGDQTQSIDAHTCAKP